MKEIEELWKEVAELKEWIELLEQLRELKKKAVPVSYPVYVYPFNNCFNISRFNDVA